MEGFETVPFRERRFTFGVVGRLATSVPPPRFHTVKYAGVLAPASTWRARIAPRPKLAEGATGALAEAAEADAPKRARST